MRFLLVLIGVMMSAAAYAQSAPPMVGGKPLVQVKPKGGAAKPPKASPLAEKLQACLEIEDESKERLDCYDAVIPPKPVASKRKLPPAKSVTECRIVKEQDDRLTCFNGFVTKLPKT